MTDYNSFIYKWTDTLTGMYYIGVRKGSIDDGYICSSKIMLPVYLERPDTFTREILGYYEDYVLAREEEIRLLEEVDASRNPLYYNQHNGGNKDWHREGSKTIHDEKTRKKMSESLKGKIPWNKGKTGVYSKETLEKKSLSQKGIPKSEEHAKKCRIANLGKKASIETRKKISMATSGKNNPMYGKTRNHSKETIEKIRFAGIGSKRTEETKKKMSESAKGKPKSEEAKRNMSLAWEKRRLNKKEGIINGG